MAEYHTILNPKSGSGTGERSLPRIERLLKESGLDYVLVRTERRGHAVELAQQAAREGCAVVVAAGGDGTANEVINGLMAARESGRRGPALGMLCVGRGNDFAHAVGIPADLEAGCRVLVAGHRRTIDIGRVVAPLCPEGRYFGNCVGVGFDAITTIEAAKLPRLGGFLGFLIAVLKTIFLYYKGPLVRVDYDRQTLTQRTLLVSIMNGQRLGGGFIMAPGGQPDDGIFDLCIAREVSRRRILTLLPHFMRGTQGTQAEITMGRARRFTISAEDGVLPTQSDGEIISINGKRLEIELLAKQIDVISAAPGAA
jgi:diacylglycerol kinase (ATP)